MQNNNQEEFENTAPKAINGYKTPQGKTLYLEARESESFSRLQRLVSILEIATPTIFDVGANIGQSIEKFRQVWPDSTMHSFEPNPSIFQQLADRWNQIKGVTLQQLALTDKKERLPFYATRVSEASSLLCPTERMRRISTEHKYDFDIIEIQSDTLDHYCQDRNVLNIDILKIDVQGAELSVLKGSQLLLEREAIKLIYLETTFADCYDGQTQFSDLLSYLHHQGKYLLWDITPFLYTRHDRLWATNSIFLSPSSAARIER